MNKIAKLIELVQKLPESGLDEAIEYVESKIEESAEKTPVPLCPHCESEAKRNGRQNGRQRYRCKGCAKTFGESTNTAISQSPYGEAVWKQAIRDTVDGISLDRTASSLRMAHSTAFNMRHKILLALETQENLTPTVIDSVCELDDTYVLENMKGRKLPAGYWRKSRKHGAKAQKRGISNEYLSISTGVQRDGKAYAYTKNRATSRKEDTIDIFNGHIGDEALILCDGANNYNGFGEHFGCAVMNVNVGEGEKGFSNINTANSFHSFIKDRYNQYRGVATKYINRYNTLFSLSFRCNDSLINDIYNILISNDSPRHRSVNDVKSLNLLII
jgi:transposase-like protein